jgi:hypothetical protein
VQSASNGCVYTVAVIGVLVVLTCTGLIVPLLGLLFLLTGFFGSVWVIGYMIGALKSNGATRGAVTNDPPRPVSAAAADPWANPRNTPFNV